MPTAARRTPAARDVLVNCLVGCAASDAPDILPKLAVRGLGALLMA
jgi:hypothetical protein